LRPEAEAGLNGAAGDLPPERRALENVEAPEGGRPVIELGQGRAGGDGGDVPVVQAQRPQILFEQRRLAPEGPLEARELRGVLLEASLQGLVEAVERLQQPPVGVEREGLRGQRKPRLQTMVNDRGGFAECVTEARGRLAMLRSVVRRLWAGIQGGSPNQLLAARDRSGVQGGHADAHRERPTVCFEHAAWKGSGVGTLEKMECPTFGAEPGSGGGFAETRFLRAPAPRSSCWCCPARSGAPR